MQEDVRGEARGCSAVPQLDRIAAEADVRMLVLGQPIGTPLDGLLLIRNLELT